MNIEDDEGIGFWNNRKKTPLSSGQIIGRMLMLAGVSVFVGQCAYYFIYGSWVRLPTIRILTLLTNCAWCNTPQSFLGFHEFLSIYPFGVLLFMIGLVWPSNRHPGS